MRRGPWSKFRLGSSSAKRRLIFSKLSSASETLCKQNQNSRQNSASLEDVCTNRSCLIQSSTDRRNRMSTISHDESQFLKLLRQTSTWTFGGGRKQNCSGHGWSFRTSNVTFAFWRTWSSSVIPTRISGCLGPSSSRFSAVGLYLYGQPLWAT